jgi:hypothetical protein
MLRRHRAALNPRTTAGPLVVHQQPHLSRAAGSFPGHYAPIVAVFGQDGYSQKLPFESEYLTRERPHGHAAIDAFATP